MDPEPIEDAELAAAAAAVRRYLIVRVPDRGLVDDLTQESLLKLLEVRHRLERRAAVPYAVTVAKNLMIGRVRSTAVAERHKHRLIDEVNSPAADDLVLRHEDELAMRAALEAMPEDDRMLLVSHVIEGADTATLAAGRGGTAGGVAARLARARARARVDYVLASHRKVLPTDQCRPVLLSLSAADRRRQEAVGAADHLVGCVTCADLAPPLVERRRSSVALLPIPFLAQATGAIRGFVKGHPVGSAVGAVGVAVATVVAVVAASGSPRRPTSSPPTTVRPTTTTQSRVPPSRPPLEDIDVRRLLPLPVERLRALSTRRVVARRVPVLSVPADEGFWIGYGDRRIWVQLSGLGESPARVVTGRSASFRGRLILNTPKFPGRAGLRDPKDRARLTQMGAHVTVSSAELVLTDAPD